MSVLTQPVIKQSRLHEEVRTAKEWLDALISGACNLPTFLSGTEELLRAAPDVGWDLLALVDQYYRRGKISAQLFGTVKAHMQGLLVGNGTEVSQPIPVMQDEPPARARASATVAMPTPERVPPTPPAAAAAQSVPVSMPVSMPISVPHIERSMPVSMPVSVPHIARSVPVSVPVLMPSDAAAAGSAAGDSSHAPPRTLAVGDVLRGRYRIQGLLGRGGMGTVFAAADQYRVDRSGRDQRIALKVLHTEIIKRPRLFAELRREFQHLQSLSHPNIVRVHEFDRDGDLAFFTMEYLSGALLSRVMAVPDAVALDRPYALAIIRDVGAAIAHAHARGVVHGDLNPANIFITDTGEVRVLDFGASHQLHHGPWISEFDEQRPLAVATPTFASCQVLEGEVADARDDVYALACVAYALLTGKHPFNDETALKARSARSAPRRPAGLDRSQWNALREGLRFDRDRRPSNVQSWLDRLELRAAAPRLPALQTLMETRPRRGGAAKWAVAAALAAVAAAAAALFAVNDFSSARTFKAVNAWMGSVLSQPSASRPRHAPPNPASAESAGTAGSSASPDAVEQGPPLAADRPTAPPTPASPPGAPRPQATVSQAPPVSPVQPSAPRAERPSLRADSTREAAPALSTGAPSTGPTSTGAASTGPTSAGGAGAPSSAAAPAGAAARAALPSPSAPTAAVASNTPAASAPGSAAAGTVQTGSASRARIELAVDNVEVPPGEATARIIVRRTRTLREDVSFKWWTESGTAKALQDFAPVKTQTEHIAPGQNSVDLVVPVVVDPNRRAARNFYVVIDEASDNAALGPRTLTMVTVPGAE